MILASVATSTVWSHKALSIIPMPFGDGQISGLISFIIHAWWPAPSVEPGVDGVLDAVVGVVAAVDPALERGPEEARRDVLVAVLVEPRLAGEERVLEHRRADVVVVDDVEVVGLVQLAGLRVVRLEDLRVLVVDHRLGDVDLALTAAAAMSKAWMTFVVVGRLASRPVALRGAPAVTSNSLPKSQTPTFLPAKSAGLGDVRVLPRTDSVPERWKIWAMSTRSEAVPRAPRGPSAPRRS